ncbi:mannitol dehydrogenase family protein [Fulvimarina endophytica]|uniref:Mannitol dehydrogenase family protein n=1 Tax=Fulvimarina endophytica TaxID=2293836 RepID=A0A371X2F6_9HYPH|nr:mannitol dehydrogenase family protein [Fulvimarina endophytica]
MDHKRGGKILSTTPIVQFGTSRFLQAHAALFISQALQAGEGLGPVTVVQSSGDPARAGRVSALAKGYDVRIRGLEDGEAVDRVARVSSIARGLSLAGDQAEVTRILTEEALIVISNVSEAGLMRRPADRSPGYDAAMSYPAKLAHLLRARYEAGMGPLQMMPTELVRDNGRVLRDLVLEAAGGMEADYRRWLGEEVVWVNSLVDRIVSEPIEPAGAVAEPYALWAIEDRPDLVLPCRHAAIDVVADLGPIERRKLFILNLGHTVMVSQWLKRRRQGPQLVREVMAEAAMSRELAALYAEEVLPGFAAGGEGEGAEAYVAITLERFANPYLDHRLADIAQNHAEKLDRRIGAFLDWARTNGDGSAKPRLEAAMKERSS